MTSRIPMSRFALALTAAIACWAGATLVGCEEAECPVLSEFPEGYCAPIGSCVGSGDRAVCVNGVWTCPPGMELAGLCPVRADGGAVPGIRPDAATSAD